MDSLPQEIIDKIIDNLSVTSSLRSSSLVAKRWQRRSQQRLFNEIEFNSEPTVNTWHTEIQSNHSGISSYVKSVGFINITEWRDPTLFGRALKNFDSLTELEIFHTGISNEMLEHVSHGELSRIATLRLRSFRSSLSTMISMIFKFPDLRALFIVDFIVITPGEGQSAHYILPQRRLLDSLLVRGRGNGAVAEALAQHQSASRRLTLDTQPQIIKRLLTFSSISVVELVLIGVYSSCGRSRDRK